LTSTHESSDNFAAQLRGFGALGIFSILIIFLTGTIFIGNMIALPVGAALVLVWIRLSHTPWREIGYERPKSWVIALITGIAFGIALKFLMKAFIMPLFGADPINHAYHFLAGNKAMLPAAIWAMLVAGFGEETIFRGFMFERLSKLFGRSALKKTLIVLITASLFGLAHYYNQGIAGVEQAAIIGLIYGTVVAVTKKIWFVMFAHAAFDITALAMIYYNLETEVSHLIFK
jgi:membrane protease YdiL (CAAX protease family)